MSPSLAEWGPFYVVVGSAGGALTGLLFVVITLTAGRRSPGVGWALGAFTTPTVAHFGAVLLVSALLSAPWPGLAPPALLLGLIALAGIAYVALITRRLRRRISYEPGWEDWLWYALLPFVAYAALLVMALLLQGIPTQALFGIGAALVLLLVIGIHNAWDLATYTAIVPSAEQQDQRAEQDENSARGERVE